MKAWTDVWWVDETTVLTISAYLTQWEQGHGWMRLPYHHIYICGANPEPLFLHCYASGFQVGFLFPVQAQCRLWALEQYCVQRAGKKLHVAIFTSYCVRELLFPSKSGFMPLYWMEEQII